MIVDIKDIKHLLTEIISEFQGVKKKQDKLKKDIRKRIGFKSPKLVPYTGNTKLKFVNKDKKYDWHVYYSVQANRKKQQFDFVYIKSIDINKEKEYIVIYPNGRESASLHIFRSHFIKRIKERTGLNGRSAEHILSRYFIEGEFGYCSNEIYSDDYRFCYINKWGISLGDYDHKIKIVWHGSILNQEDLFEDQEEKIISYFKSVIIRNSPLQNEKLYNCYSNYLDKKGISISDKHDDIRKLELANLDSKYDLDNPEIRKHANDAAYNSKKLSIYKEIFEKDLALLKAHMEKCD